MDLGIRGRTAIVWAASRGLGRAIAIALAQEGVNLVINARSEATLVALAEEISGDRGPERQRHVREALDEDGMLISLQRFAAHRLIELQAYAAKPAVEFRTF